MPTFMARLRSSFAPKLISMPVSTITSTIANALKRSTRPPDPERGQLNTD
jgi:hypothetical protein